MEIVERWRDVPGYQGKYQVSTLGGVRRVLKNGDTRPINGFYRNNLQYVSLRTMTADGSRPKIYTVLRLVAMAWADPPSPPGMMVCHANRMHTDDSLVNVVYRTRAANARKRRVSNRRPVEVLDKQGRVIGCYESVSEASRQTGIPRTTINGVCAGQRKGSSLDLRFRWLSDRKRKK